MSTINGVSVARRVVSRYRRLRGDLLERGLDAPPVPTGAEPELRLLFVCHGNSCRSPLAEGIVRTRLAAEGLLGRVVVDSAGTSAGDPGAQPNWRAREVARRHGIAIGDLRARELEPRDLDHFDRILAFDQSNVSNILRLATTAEQAAKVSLLDAEREIQDPVHGGYAEHEACFSAIERAVEPLIADVHARLAPGG